MSSSLQQRFQALLPAVDFCSLRVVTEITEILSVRQDVIDPPFFQRNQGAMVTVIHQGGLGYAALSDLSNSGLQNALKRASEWAARSKQCSVTDFSKIVMPHPHGNYYTRQEKHWDSLSLRDKLDLLHDESKLSALNDKIVDWAAQLEYNRYEQEYFTSEGGEVEQVFDYIFPVVSATAYGDSDSQQRTMGGHGYGQQGGLEVLDRVGFAGSGRQVAEEALQLLAAPNCPQGKMDVVLAPDQMVLQIHESIGHPLELDRILGDERNYAGTSFVTQDMFGSYQYGSDLLNVTFDPTPAEEFASYAFDDDGLAAEKTYLIENGLLLRPLGGHISQQRSGLPGVANARANTWNRPPIDRMANLNVEPGDSSRDDLIAGVEHGVYMAANRSWSIDDSRNKFQFGCEWGQLIENGKLTSVVKNPNYRGISATFWRSLSGVGNRDTFEVLGVPYCGKGEPNQIIRVGHASPVCRFSDIDVFGGV